MSTLLMWYFFSSLASSIPRGIVTATTVPKGSNLPSPSPATPPLSKPPSQATGTHSDIPQTIESALELPAESIPVEFVSKTAIQDTSAPQDAMGVRVQSSPSPVVDGIQSSPSLLTSQLLEAHSLLQQQGVTPPSQAMDAPEVSVEDDGTDLGAPPPSGLSSAPGGLNIPPELLAQVSSLFNFPTVSPSSPPLSVASPAPLSTSDGGSRTLTSQGKRPPHF